MQNFNFQKGTDSEDEPPVRKAGPQTKRIAQKQPGNPDQDEYQRTDTEDWAKRQYLLKQTALAPYLAPNLQTADRREDEMFSRFSATWMANTATSAALSLNAYLAADLKIAAAQGQTPTTFETFFATHPTHSAAHLSVLQSRLNLIRKVRDIHGIKGAQFHIEKLPPLPLTVADRVKSIVNYAQAELEHQPRTLNNFTRTIAEINDKTQKRETIELLRCVESEADRKRYANGPAIFQQVQRLQQSEQALSIREDTQYIELIQTRNNFQNWYIQKTGIQPTSRDLLSNPREEDLNYDLKISIANFLYSKLHERAEALRTERDTSRNADASIDPQHFQHMPDQDFLRGINWQTQGKAIHPNSQQLQMMRDALTAAAAAFNSTDKTQLDEFLKIGDKKSSGTHTYASRPMQILWIAGAEGPCKLGVYKAANRKLQNDLHVAFEGNVLEKLIHLIKANFRWFSQLQQLVMINRQLATIHRDLNPNLAAHQEQHTSALRNMPRL